MSGVDTLRSIETGVAEVQTALGVVQGGLHAVETVADGAEAARSGLRTVVKFIVVLVIIAGIVEGLRRWQGDEG